MNTTEIFACCSCIQRNITHHRQFASLPVEGSSATVISLSKLVSWAWKHSCTGDYMPILKTVWRTQYCGKMPLNPFTGIKFCLDFKTNPLSFLCSQVPEHWPQHPEHEQQEGEGSVSWPLQQQAWMRSFSKMLHHQIFAFIKWRVSVLSFRLMVSLHKKQVKHMHTFACKETL